MIMENVVQPTEKEKMNVRKNSDPAAVAGRSDIADAKTLVAKRLFDILVALVGMIVFSPLYIISYIAIKIEDGGAAIFHQERVG